MLTRFARLLFLSLVHISLLGCCISLGNDKLISALSAYHLLGLS